MSEPDSRYPIGKFQRQPASDANRSQAMAEIAAAPANLRAVITGLSPAQLDTPYREGGWTVRQVVHHVADSHMNAYVRCKLALTEDAPAIKPYNEARWAELGDSQSTPLETSLALLEALHQRWLVLLRGLKPNDFSRVMRHPVSGDMSVDDAVAMYAWHGRHHVAHISALRARRGWN